MFLNVCKFLGKQFDADPTIIRIAFVVWFFINPSALFWYCLSGIILYLFI